MPFLLFLSVFSLYMITTVPVIYFEDNPMFITTAYTLGLAHPPGYPLISMLGNLAGFFPFGNFAFRCNILSGVFASTAVTLFYLCALQLNGRRLSAALFSLLFALSGNLWTQAVIFEVYTLFFAFFFFLLWVSLSGRLNDFRWIMLSAFLFGLGVTNHVALSVTLPGFLLLWYRSKESFKYRLSAKNLGLILAAGVFSWSIQLYTLLRSKSHIETILFSWGRVNGFSEFADFVTGYKTYRDFNFSSMPLNARWNLFFEYISAAVPVWGWFILVPLVITGVYRFFLNDKLKLLSLCLIFSALLLYSILQIAAMDIMLVIPWGVGLLVALYGLETAPPKVKNILSPCMALFIIWFAANQYSRYDYHSEYSAYNYFSDVSDILPDNGALKLREGIQMNYILLYGILGPGGGLSQEGSDKKAFSPYTLEGGELLFPWGLLNSEGKIEKEEEGSPWEHIRSYPFNDTNKKGLKTLTRNMFKSIVLSRVALQRGYSFLEEDNVPDAEKLFKRAADLNAPTVFSETVNLLSAGNFKASEKLLEALTEREVSPALIRLLHRVKLLSDSGTKPK